MNTTNLTYITQFNYTKDRNNYSVKHFNVQLSVNTEDGFIQEVSLLEGIREVINSGILTVFNDNKDFREKFNVYGDKNLLGTTFRIKVGVNITIISGLTQDVLLRTSLTSNTFYVDGQALDFFNNTDIMCCENVFDEEIYIILFCV